MARLIVKSPYIKCGGNQGAGGYMKYIATRERVEIIPDDRPPTRKQEQLITKLVNDFPDTKELLEYEDYTRHPTKANASSLITLALEENWSQVRSSEGYAKYIATRPRAERLGNHGLFSDEDGVDLDQAMSELEHYTGNVWTHIISLHREDAERLGYDNAKAWRSLLCTHRNDIAAAMKIPPQDFRWYAAFHDEGKHPHVHVMAWSVKPGQAYLSKDGIRQIKSTLTNQIFKQEMLHLYEQKSESRDELVRETRKVMLELSRQMSESVCEHPEAEQMMLDLAQQLGNVRGKKSYGYLPKGLKKQVDEIVDQMERLPIVNECYQKWWELQCRVSDFYSERERQRPPLSQQKEFRAIKNAVIQEAERIRKNQITYEDGRMEDQGGWLNRNRISPNCLDLWDRANDKSSSLEDRDEAATELEKLAGEGDIHAQFLTGVLYRDGGLFIPDAEKARYWFEQAAKREFPQAQYALGKLLLSDDRDVHDSSEGIRWMKAAAQNGNDYAAYALGKEYLTGKHVVKNQDLAKEYLQQAAENENPWAQYLLGKLYLTGEGAGVDNNAAHAWFQAAAKQGHTYAQFFVDRMEQQGQYGLPGLLLSATRLLHHMGNIFRDCAPSNPAPGGMQIDRKRLQKLREKKVALGHRPDDHEEEQTMGGMTMGGW
ncbi:MobP3 family relaxase [Flintibacter sp. KGMB00164]|uniref:MobP3 family relaxase n=1 Tax=Flintibacter sp. KGMB00164 TaxID=2610895 RepID=UPI00124936CA|nr:MobP3 family relaxase [Flintibacter sp. KGMB00164]